MEGRSGCCHPGFSQDSSDLVEIIASQQTDQGPTQVGRGGFLCLSSFPIALSPLTTYTITVRSSSSYLTFIPSASLPVFCFWEAMEAIVERVGALGSLRLGPYHLYLLSDLE